MSSDHPTTISPRRYSSQVWSAGQARGPTSRRAYLRDRTDLRDCRDRRDRIDRPETGQRRLDRPDRPGTYRGRVGGREVVLFRGEVRAVSRYLSVDPRLILRLLGPRWLRDHLFPGLRVLRALPPNPNPPVLTVAPFPRCPPARPAGPLPSILSADYPLNAEQRAQNAAGQSQKKVPPIKDYDLARS